MSLIPDILGYIVGFLEYPITDTISMQELLWSAINLIGLVCASVSYRFVHNDYEFQRLLYKETAKLLTEDVIAQFELLSIVATQQLREEILRFHQHFMSLIIGIVAMMTPSPVRDSVQTFANVFALILLWLAATWMWGSVRAIVDRMRIQEIRSNALADR